MSSSHSSSSETKRSTRLRSSFSPRPKKATSPASSRSPFEIAYVLHSQYALTPRQLATVVRAVTSFPGMHVVNDCPWKRVLEIWPDPLTGLTDAAIVALATTNRYAAVATFDRKLANKLENFGLAAYF